MNCTAPLVLVRSNFLKGEAIKQKIIDHVETELKRVDIKNTADPEIIKFICDVIENSVYNKKRYFDDPNPKLSIFKAVMYKLHPNVNENDIEGCIKVCEYLLKHKMIKKVAWWKIIKFFVVKNF